ncbi:hypothetical protein [Streptomyces sp. NPDC055189]
MTSDPRTARTPDPATLPPLPAHNRVVVLTPLLAGTNAVAGDFTYCDDPGSATAFATIRQRFEDSDVEDSDVEDSDIEALLRDAWWDWPVELVTAYARTVLAGSPRGTCSRAIARIAADEGLEPQQ